jgi:hypothetical protein
LLACALPTFCHHVVRRHCVAQGRDLPHGLVPINPRFDENKKIYSFAVVTWHNLM